VSIVNKNVISSILIIFILFVLNNMPPFKAEVVDYNFVLKGKNEITIFENEEYVEEGYNITSCTSQDLSNNVIIENNLDVGKVGSYEIKYKALYKGIKKELNRKVNVIAKEKIDEWIQIPTYDGSNETTHPKVIYFENGYRGYKYWMVHTPYPFNDASLENPSIAVSNDGLDWIVPKGVINPVSGTASKYGFDSYYSDPFMLYDGNKFEMFFRRTKSYLNGVYKSNGYNYIHYMESDDGINWRESKLILDNNPNEQYMSISVNKINGIYKIWYVNYDGEIRYIESKDLKNFTEPVNINIENFDKKAWHKEIQYIDGKYVCILMIKYKLYYMESEDGINFGEPKLIETKLDNINTTVYNIYKTSFVITDKYIELFIPYGVNHKWRMKYIKVSKDDFYNSLK